MGLRQAFTSKTVFLVEHDCICLGNSRWQSRVCNVQVVRGHLQEVKGLLGEPQEVTVASLKGAGPLTDWKDVFRITQVTFTIPYFILFIYYYIPLDQH